MRYEYGVPEDPSKGNPRQLSVWQHVFPVASIRRFNDNTGKVDLRHFSRSIRRFATPSDRVFCARRAWDQRAESGFMRSIENDYQAVVREIIDLELWELSHEQSSCVSAFMALWQLRALYRNRHDNFAQTGLRESDWLTKEQEELLESRRMIFSRPDGIIPARFMNGFAIQIIISQMLRTSLSEHQWGVVRASSGEFLVPDQPLVSLIPVTPTMCLCYNNPSGYITSDTITAINTQLYINSLDYCFARSFPLCPIQVPSQWQVSVPLTSYKE